MANTYVNKVVQSDGTALIDITDTTATASTVFEGEIFYLANGARTVGTATEQYLYQDSNGYLHVSASLPSSDSEKIWPIILKSEISVNVLVDSEGDNIVDSSGDNIVMVER